MNTDQIIKIPGLSVSFLVRPIIGTPPLPWADIETDLLVLDFHEHMHFGQGMNELDEFTGGALTRAVKEQHFAGRLGEHILVSQPSEKLRHILLLGAGPEANRIHTCGLVALILEFARRLGAKQVTIPLCPGRLREMSLAGTMAVLRCRLGQVEPALLTTLQRIEILSTVQAKRWIVEGLTISDSLCHQCMNPTITLKTRIGRGVRLK